MILHDAENNRVAVKSNRKLTKYSLIVTYWTATSALIVVEY